MDNNWFLSYCGHCCLHFLLFLDQKAMDIVGFNPDEKHSIYTLLSAILNLGNVTFEEEADHGAAHDFVTLSNGKCKLCLHCNCEYHNNSFASNSDFGQSSQVLCQWFENSWSKFCIMTERDFELFILL